MTDKTEKTADQQLADALKAIESLQTSVTKLEGFNEVLKQENKEFKAQAAEAETARDLAAAQAERDSADVTAIEKRLKTAHDKEVVKLTGERDTALSQLRTTLVDNEIAKAIRDNNVRDGMDEALTALFTQKAKFENNQANIEGMSIADYVSEYVGSERGAVYRRPSDNSGVDATGSTTKAPVQHGFTRGNFKSKEGEWMVLAGTDPVTAKQAALDVGRADLASTL